MFADACQPLESVILPAKSILIQELPVHSKVYFSTIISDEHKAEISSWIDHKITTYSLTNHLYEFQLILRWICSSDMWLRWYSDYNPLIWSNTNNNTVFIQARDSFIFSLKNNNIQNSILSKEI
ncbi:hypothetical protein Glove_166g222 [Diversispora epigaea]|uniref:Uncharacterized protein n=1 Tax=Diversispora epigaea TaxID=1348612 RepID=A0A397IUC4_9GLOM|nr:hypothetical protein Glove_166g222 [Diversispora epigaea]